MVSAGGGAVSECGVWGPKGIGGVIHSLKRGPWTAAEDAMLMEYVKKHGEGNWNAVQKNSGLMRCGKSCRLRWACCVCFQPIVKLPGRTDNEIKNYWNTRMKRRQRAGLPIYPQEIQEKAAAAFHLLQHHHHRPPNNPSSSLSSLLATQNPTYNPSLSMFNAFNFSSTENPLQNQASSCYSNPKNQFQLSLDTTTTSGLSLPLSSTPPYAPSSASLLNQNISGQTMPMPSFKFNGGNNFQLDMSFSSMITGASIDGNPLDLVSGIDTKLPSSQLPPQHANSASSGSSDRVCALGIPSNNNNNDYHICPKTTTGNSGLLDALVQESQKLSSNEKFFCESFSDVAEKRKSVADASSTEEEGNEGVESKMVNNRREANADNQCDERRSSHSSIGMKTSDQEPLEEMNSMDDDLMSLLNNFPLSMPLPECYSGTSDSADANQNNDLSSPAATAAASPDLQWSLGSYCWNTMPSIC